MKISPPFLLCLLLFSFSSTGRAEVKPNHLFTDGMVLQQATALPVWGTAKEGEKVVIQFEGDRQETVTKDGKWLVHLKPHEAGGPFTMTITGENNLTIKDVLVGEVWVCSGQSNMSFALSGASNADEERPKANYPEIRMYHVPMKPQTVARTDTDGKWIACTPAEMDHYSAVGYFFARDLYKALGVPIGMIHTSFPGSPAQAWTSLSALKADPALKPYTDAYQELMDSYPKDAADYQAKLKAWNESEPIKTYHEALKTVQETNAKLQAEGKPLLPEPARPPGNPPPDPSSPETSYSTPTALYNGMLAPLIPYAIKGVIWYQGEANVGDQAILYRTLFPCLIGDWRARWKEGDFPFLFVQIAPWAYFDPEIRESQFLTWKNTKNTAMAVTTDVGDANDIHPKRKEPVGTRLALSARALAYGEKIEYSGPAYDAMKVDGDHIVLTFTHVGGGLVAKDGPLKGFTITGADGKFVPAKAEIRGATVVVSSDQVPLPTAVRFGWAPMPDVNLYNKEGLPASPFKSDVH